MIRSFTKDARLPMRPRQLSPFDFPAMRALHIHFGLDQANVF